MTELPKPQLGEPKSLSALRIQPVEEDALTMSHTLDKLLAIDTIQVEPIPEKKGLFLKHVEYQVTSQVWPSVEPVESHTVNGSYVGLSGSMDVNQK